MKGVRIWNYPCVVLSQLCWLLLGLSLKLTIYSQPACMIYGNNLSKFIVQFRAWKFIFTIPFSTCSRSLRTRSTVMLKKLKKAGIGKRPIIWVGHSMGGNSYKLKPVRSLKWVTFHRDGCILHLLNWSICCLLLFHIITMYANINHTVSTSQPCQSCSNRDKDKLKFWRCDLSWINIYNSVFWIKKEHNFLTSDIKQMTHVVFYSWCDYILLICQAWWLRR